MSDTTRLRALTEASLLHSNPDAVLAPLFTGVYLLASDKVQVKCEMLRARLVDGLPVSEAAAAHGYSPAAFYLVTAAFDQSGMAGLIDERTTSLLVLLARVVRPPDQGIKIRMPRRGQLSRAADSGFG